MELTVKRRPRGFGFVVPLEGESLPRILSYLRGTIIMAEAVARSKGPWRPRDPEAHGGDDEDKGRVRWHFGTRSWQVLYEDAAGVRHSLSKGFHAPTPSVYGNVLDAAGYAQLRGSLLKKARDTWNQLDESGADRYPASMLQEN